jgi:hypothetical protein
MISVVFLDSLDLLMVEALFIGDQLENLVNLCKPISILSLWKKKTK